MSDLRFPKLQKQLSDFLFDEEGSIPRSKIVSVGTMILLLTVFYADSAFAKHSSHSSHRSHSSHSSHRSHTSGSHGSHSNHHNATPTPVPLPKNVSMPSMPEANGDTWGGFSAVPETGGDPNIILARFGNEEAGAVPTPAPVSASSGVDALIAAEGGTVPSVLAGVSPASVGMIPASTGVLIPGAALLESNMETVDHHFNPFLEDTEYSVPSSVMGKPVDIGTLPKDPGSPVN